MKHEKVTTERPEVVLDEHLEYLDELRESGQVNMFGAQRFLRDDFGLEPRAAVVILRYWMDTFAERHRGGGEK